MPTRLLPSGSEFQVNIDIGGGNGVDGGQSFPDAVTLTDGRMVVAYQSANFGIDANSNPIVSILGSISYLDAYDISGPQTGAVVAPRLGGALGVVFTNPRHADGTVDANGDNITFVPVSAGGVAGTPVAIGDFDGGLGHDALLRPDVAMLSTGRQVVVFERLFSTTTDHDIFLNVVNAAGTGTQFNAAAPLSVNSNSSYQGLPSVAANANQALVVYEDATATTISSANISARLFDGASNTLGAQFTIAGHSAELFSPNVAALADGRYIITYTDKTDMWGRIYDPSTPGGAFISDEFRIDAPGGLVYGSAAAATVDGGFIVTWIQDNGTDYDIQARRFDAHGLAFGDEFTVNTLTDSDQISPTITTSGGAVLIAWTDFGSRPTDNLSGPGVRGQAFTTTVFDYDSAGIGDLDGNGHADILFQNDTGDVEVWQTNGNGAVFAVTSLGQRPAGYLIDGTGNFNGTPGDDILLRSSGTLAVWPTSGIAAGTPVVIGFTSVTYHNAGIGDFTGDGQDDLLFRSDSGQLVTWAIANNALAAAPQILGSTSLAYHIVGIDDFTGDQQSDILFRNDNGSIALWQVADNQLLSAKLIGSTSTAYHVVSTGDFDGNGAKDILFRSDTGELVEWLLDSTGGLLMSPTSIGTIAANYHVDGTGDLNGDGRDDIIFRDAGGTLVEWLMNGTSLAAPPAVMGALAVDYAVAAHHFEVA